jgi:TRAP-type uncharacterized transport system substrate-binding protein
MRRTLLWVAPVLLVALFAGGATFLAYQNYPWLFPTKDTIRIATGPLTEADEKFVDAFLREMAKESPRIQVVFTRTAGLDASADALKSGKVDAALVRSDNPMAAEGRTLAVMRRIAVMAILGGQSSAKSWSDLAGKTVGVLSSSGQIDPLQKIVLDFYGITAERLRGVAPVDVGALIADEQIAALLAIGPPGGPGRMADAARAIHLAIGKPPKVLELDAADPISERYPAYEKLDVSPGALVGLPPMPPKGAAALAVAVRLVSNRALSNYSAGEITRVILATKARLAGSEIGVGDIEAPDTDKPVFPIHPGTLAHLEGEKPATLDDSLTYLAIGSILLGALGSFGAWLGGFLTTRLRGKTRERIAALASYLVAIKTGSSDDLDRIENELDELSEWLMEHYVREEIPSERYSALQAKIAEIRTVLTRRRATIGKDQGVRLVTRSR